MLTKCRGIFSSKMLTLLSSNGPCRTLAAGFCTDVEPKKFLHNQSIEVIKDTEHCNRVMNQLKEHCNDYNVLGFDCEWVIANRSRHPVAVLQLASHKGLCALIRLNALKKIPSSLQQILEDRNILKAGISSFENAKYLSNDYGAVVDGTLDLRYLANLAHFESGDLVNLCMSHIGQILQKDWQIQVSNWEATELSAEQKKYAANDAHVAIEVFRALAKKFTDASKAQASTGVEEVQHIVGECNFVLDTQYINDWQAKTKLLKPKHKFKLVPLEDHSIENRDKFFFKYV